MATGIQISDLSVVVTAVLGTSGYLIKSWFDSSSKITERRAAEVYEFSKLMYEFIDNHRENKVPELKLANDKFRTAIPPLIIWGSARLEIKLASFLEISNAYVKKISSGGQITDMQERNFTNAFSNLQYALKLDALGWSVQGIQLRLANKLYKRQNSKKKKKT